MLLRIISTTILLILLSGCGGGGSENSAPEIPLLDTDGDGQPNNQDLDDDNDGVEDTNDTFPLDSSESLDSDSDGVGNNADTDDDNDGVEDTNDAFPLDSAESLDSDSDGMGNNADTDDDNDGVEDVNDAFPLDLNEWLETDGDGIGNNADTDDDNDGVEDANDAFPLDPEEWLDTDGDGMGNNADTDDDNDAVEDANDAFPLDLNEWLDTDGDGIGNNADTDDDNDGVEDSDDAFPLDPNESVDSDNDGFGANSDAFDNDPACYAASDGQDNVCYLTYISQNENVISDESDSQIFFYLENLNKILVFNGEQGHFSQTFDISSDITISALTYANGRIYFSLHLTGEIKYISLETGGENDFATSNDGDISSLYISDSIVITKTGDNLKSYDENGTLLDSEWIYNYYSEHQNLSWFLDEYSFYYSYDNDTIRQIKINPITGRFSRVNLDGNFEVNLTEQRILHTLDDSFFITNRGSIQKNSSNTISQNKLYETHFDKIIETDDELISASYIAGSTVISRYDTNLRLIQTEEFPGTIKHVVGNNAQYTIIAKQIDGYISYRFVFSEDSDDDGVNNSNDAFPIDAAASKDTDDDGFPDAWNTDWSGDTHLSLDKFPNDFSCWLDSHSDDQGNCNYSTFSQTLSVDTYEMTTTGDAYLVDLSKGIVARFDSHIGTYKSPIKLSKENTFYNPNLKSVSYSETHQRVYYLDRTYGIYFFDVASSETNNQFLNFSQNKTYNNVKATGEFVYVDYQVPNSSAYRFDVADINSSIVSSDNIARNFTQFLTADGSTLYAYDNSSTYRNLYKYNIDQQTGYVDQQEPISTNGQLTAGYLSLLEESSQLLLPNGELYNADDMSYDSQLLRNLQAVTIENEQILLFSKLDSGFKLRRMDKSFSLYEEFDVDSSYLGSFSNGSKHYYITSQAEGNLITRYIPNDDIDGDGVSNVLDHFPSDPAASLDSDNDDYPDEWNSGYSADDSSSDLVLDEFPQDSACWDSSHNDGNNNCDYSATIPIYTAEKITTDEQGKAYFYDLEMNKIFVWNQLGESYQNPLFPNGTLKTEEAEVTQIAASTEHERLYLGYSNGVITYIDLSTNSREMFFAEINQSVAGLSAVGNFLLAQDYSGSGATHFIFDIDGNLTDTKDWNYGSTHWMWNESNSRVYYYSHYSPRDLLYEEIDQGSGLITSVGETLYQGDYSLNGVIRLTPSKDKIYLGSGNIFNVNSLLWEKSIGQVNDIAWLPSGQRLVFQNVNSEITIERYDNDDFREFSSYPGEFVTTISSTSGVTLVSLVGGEYQFTNIVINNDIDNDGVENHLDDFPFDAAASIDTDKDGFPDQWNTGKSQSDSSQALILDAFINDSACWLETHDDGTGECDVLAALIRNTPDGTTKDNNGNLLMLNKANKQIMRWSTTQNEFINPLNLGRAYATQNHDVSSIEYSVNHNRIYITYDNGLVTFISDESSYEEQFYLKMSNISQLVSVGGYLLIVSPLEFWSSYNIYTTYDENGNVADSTETYFSNTYEWDEINHRLYFFRDNVSPNDLLSIDIDQADGSFSNLQDSPYHSSENIIPPIVAFSDLKKVLLGSGKFYNGESLELLGALEQSFEFAASFSHLGFYAYEEEGTSTVALFDVNDYSVLSTFEYINTLIALEVIDESLLIITDENGFEINTISMGDDDADGLPAWWERIYGLSDEDATDSELDNDSDGLSNLEEFLVSTNPLESDTDSDGLNDGNEINVHGSNPTLSDTDNDGLNDGQEVNQYGTEVTNSDSDGDGFTDGQEILVYMTDPLDANSKPSSITNLEEPFENEQLGPLWSNLDTSDATWGRSDEFSDSGSYSLKSGTINDNQKSEIMLSGLFAEGTLSFKARLSSESCCDRLNVYLNGESVINSALQSWQEFSLNLPEGENEIIFTYSKDSSVSSGFDAAYIDTLEFVSN